jgi:2-succinyl-5-enolpyruvyl-6-hydroxy-3-cyclohexene-1-carboxylate synthase
LTGPGAAVELWKQVPTNSTFVLAPSWPIRHIELYAPNRTDLITFGNRGVNGIDGLISTAAGIALKNDDRTYLLIGDIAFLHGMGGLNISAPNQTPNLTVVVLDNDGSGIFSQLEQGSSKYQKYFEQIFGTPHGRDLWVIAESLGVPAVRVTTKTELTAALNRTNKIPGLHVIVCSTGSRQNEQLLIEEISTELKGRI